ncbi:MAG: DUF1499 domain-containing protein [Acetobacteraceae bacterium]
MRRAGDPVHHRGHVAAAAQVPMSVPGWLIGLLLPACAAVGARGLPHPPLRDMTRIERPATPNTALAAPADFVPKPDLPTPVYPVPAAVLFAALRAVASAQPRTYLAAAYPDHGQLHWVVRSAFWNFPDRVTGQVLADGAHAARLILYSASVYGYGDLGVNRRRLKVWLAALAAVVPAPLPEGPPHG